ncbi:MAG: zinc-ribbon domain-containing protein [Candidatus Lokiarchaeota archaeon]|nr:zinc-ribbon domain-containing protein [Candidatus Lokiarchaeota archaeon]
MFCPNCGIKIENPNQRFCKNCGSELTEFSEELRKISNPNPTPQDLGVQFIQQRRIKKSEPHSKRTLAFGIVSLIIAGTAFQYGASFIRFPFTDYLPRFVPTVFIILSISHIVGLIFGIASKINNQQARELESMNTFIKVGNVLGIIGIIINTILMVISFVIIGLLW